MPSNREKREAHLYFFFSIGLSLLSMYVNSYSYVLSVSIAANSRLSWSWIRPLYLGLIIVLPSNPINPHLVPLL